MRYAKTAEPFEMRFVTWTGLVVPRNSVLDGALILREWKMQEWTYRHRTTGLKNAGLEISRKTSGPKFTILLRHVEDILLLNKFFSDCRYVPLVAKI